MNYSSLVLNFLKTTSNIVQLDDESRDKINNQLNELNSVNYKTIRCLDVNK